MAAAHTHPGMPPLPRVLRSRRKRVLFILTALLLGGLWTVHVSRGLRAGPQIGTQHATSTERESEPRSEQSAVKRAVTDEASPAGAEDCKNCTAAATPPSVFGGVSRSGGPSLPATAAEQGTNDDSCSWLNFTLPAPPYFLTAVFIVRIYKEDLSEMTTAEVKQWLLYLRYAGVEHVYLYDLWYLPGESQREPLDHFIREGYLTYLDRHELNPYVREKSQLPSYQHCIDEFGSETTWQAAIDIDEYPFSSEDTRPGFMYRYVKKFSEEDDNISEITMNNFLFLGQKNNSRELLIEKLWRHTHGPSNKLVKPIYRPRDIKRAQVHHNVRKSGRTKTAPSSGLRINHYWGARLQSWGPDTEETLSITEEDNGMEPIVATFKRCEKYIRKYL